MNQLRKLLLSCLLLISIIAVSCKKSIKIQPPEDGKITSAEYKDDLLLVVKNDYQITASDSATFSSTDPSISITTTGLVKRITSGEVVAISVTWIKSGNTTQLYALGATDNNHVNPFEKFHAAISDNPAAQYMQGWQTLQKLPITGETYAIVLRHADADFGKDWPVIHDTEGPENWWKSPDSLLARQLNVQGIKRAIDMKTIIKDLKYPITKVVSSEFYRAIRTAELIDAGPVINIDGRINHPEYIKTRKTLFNGLLNIINESPADGKMMLISTHHPINEFERENPVPATFPQVSAFNWTGAYFVKIAADKSITYQGAASYGMFKYFRDLKMK